MAHSILEMRYLIHRCIYQVGSTGENNATTGIDKDHLLSSMDLVGKAKASNHWQWDRMIGFKTCFPAFYANSSSPGTMFGTVRSVFTVVIAFA